MTTQENLFSQDNKKRLLVCVIILAALSISFQLVSRNFFLKNKEDALVGESEDFAFESEVGTPVDVAYFEDFNDGESGLDGTNGTNGLSYMDGYLKKTISTHSLIPDQTFQNFVYRADFKTNPAGKDNWHVAGLVFNFIDGEGFYHASIFKDLTLRIHRFTSPNKSTIIAQIEVREHLNRDVKDEPSIAVWNTLQLKYMDGKIEMAINDHFAGALEDPNPLPDGRLGIRQNLCTAFFDNLVVSRL